MKNLILFLLVAAAIWYGWMWMVLEFIPNKTAESWVEEVRLGIDGGEFLKSFSGYKPPLSEQDMTVPKRGIAENFLVKRTSGPKAWDPTDSHVITFLVKFKPSPVAPNGPETESEYILIMKSTGSYVWPDWRAQKFLPEKVYEQRKKRDELLKKGRKAA